MLSYQHAYHAGNAADCLKHSLWALLLQHLTQKEGVLNAYETHAGRGLYHTDAPEMQQLQEYATGLARLYTGPQALPLAGNPYLQTVAAHNPPQALLHIPGSPAVAAHLLRPTDHLHLCEAHPGEFTHLQQALRCAPNAHLHATDGHQTVPGLIKPGQRNVVLLDPSYEVKTEYARTAATVAAILAKAPQTVVMVWYPLLAGKAYQTLIDTLKELKISATWLAQLRWSNQTGPGLHGTGQIILNLPYQTETSFTQALQPLVPLLKQGKTIPQLTTTMLVPRR